ncbi:MAG: MFS transporter [Akkermansiaceae bacterium]
MIGRHDVPGKRGWRSFWSLIGMQSANAYNDNFAKFVLISLGVALVSMGQGFPWIEHILAALLVVPYILLAPTAGWLGDRFAKSRVIRWSAWLQLVVLSMMIGGLWFGSAFGDDLGKWALAWVVVSFFLLAVQSALLSPAKKGLVKELVGSERLGFANGVMEGTVVLAIVLGQIVGGVWFDVWGVQEGLDPWRAALIPVSWLLVGAVLSLVLAYSIRETEPKAKEKYSWPLAIRHFRDLGKLWEQPSLRQASLGIAFFWGFGGFLQLLLIQRAQEVAGSMGGFGLETVLVWIPVMVGIVTGSALTSWVCRRSNELGLVVIGGFLMTASMLGLGVYPWDDFGLRFFLGVAGAGAAMLLVPLNTFFQDRLKESERGLMLSASNLCVNLAGVLAVVSQLTLKAIGIPVMGQFVIAGLVCLWITFASLRLLPKDFIRLVFLAFFRSVYKVRALGVENIPKKGGVLLTPNHLTYIDAFILSAACPRPIRFVLFADCFEYKMVGGFARLFDTVAISPESAREGIRLAAEALKEGSVVCVFAEGQLSRTGGLSEIKKGYQMMAKRGGAEVLPAYLDGLWGSMWSFAEGNFLRKWPRRIRDGVTVAFGKTMPWNGELPAALRELSVETMRDRETAFFRTRKNASPEVSGDLPRNWSGVLEQCWSDDETGREMRVNALQLGQVHLAHRKTRLLVEWRKDDRLSGVLGILWPLAVGARVSLADELSDREILAKVSREGINAVALRSVAGRGELIGQLAGRGILVWSFDDEGLSDGCFFGCLVKSGRVVTFARPHPDYETTTELPQSGWREGKRGKLLPGWCAEEFGPVDEEGFLLP